MTLVQFQKDIRNHKLTVKHDSGLYRHLMLSDGTFLHQFHIITAPHVLTIRGDMGCYSFERIEDMFAFFRQSRDPFAINESYWAEKSVSEDRHGHVRIFDRSIFDERVKALCMDFIAKKCLSHDEAERLLDGVKDALDDADAETDAAFIRALERYELIPDGEWKGQCPFDSDIWQDLGGAGQTYHPRFIWCLRAIRWGIGQYDAWKETEAEADRALIGTPMFGDIFNAITSGITQVAGRQPLFSARQSATVEAIKAAGASLERAARKGKDEA